MNFTRRCHYQYGCVTRKPRKKGPDVWVFRHRELQPDGTAKLRSQVFATVAECPTKTAARKAAEVLRVAANPDNPAQHGLSWGALIDLYVQKGELPKRESTRRTYLLWLNNYIRPKWGEYALTDVKPFAVQEWLETLEGSKGQNLSLKSKREIRNLMRILWGCAMRWQLVPIGANRFGQGLVRVNAGSRPQQRRSLTIAQFGSLLRHRLLANEPSRTMVLMAICLGLRCSELFALRWSDIDWANLVVHIRRGVVRGVFDLPKTSYSQAPLPLDPNLANILRSWKAQSPFNRPDDFVFASPVKGGNAPYDPHVLQQERLRPAGIDIGFGEGLGWHTFRHTYRTLLDDTGAPPTVQKELMRHGDIRMTFKYGEAVNPSKRKANSEVVNLVLAV